MPFIFIAGSGPSLLCGSDFAFHGAELTRTEQHTAEWEVMSRGGPTGSAQGGAEVGQQEEGHQIAREKQATEL